MKRSEDIDINTLDNLTSDSQLATLAANGDKSAFHQLYLRHHQRVYAISFRFAGQHALAEEVTQECFIRLWNKIDQFNQSSQFTTWLHRLCVRQAINTMKVQHTFWQRFLPFQDNDSLIEPCEQAAEYHQLDKYICRLPKQMRIVFVLIAIEGYQHNDVAQLLGIAQGTSKNHYFKAKQLLQEMLS
ncbi:RNA polymerase sigma factor [Shewanella intestini]|uniref:RNA polymerase sigma factor n=1 Tax=Shewanella intestini TaxID=2017544 RepID=A0ABS5I3A4_9GAMM|nr:MULTISPECIES: RNA polymerase sigma factor [Shewanella]MBR9728501.1 RNA polymerase sigma factor [Shewanella intestini]MRG36320.1 sigma-70 family RNA polymerase sigma factor [Shewanella sp. XMDDZSB0408]